MCDQLLRVLVFLDAAEVFQQALDQGPAVLDEAGAQRLKPGVQRPGNAWEHHHEHGPWIHKSTVQNKENAADFMGAQNRPCFHHFMVLVWAEGRLRERVISGKSEVLVGKPKEHLNVIKTVPLKKKKSLMFWNEWWTWNK